MNRIGVSLHVGTVLDEPETNAQAVLKAEYGGVQSLFRFLRSMNVASIELRNVRKKMPPEKAIRAIHLCHDAGFDVSIHIAFEECTGAEYTSRVSNVLNEALEGQKSLMLTLHPIASDRDLTAEKYESWSDVLCKRDERICLALENMRVINPNSEANRLANVYHVVNSISEREGRGLCWDMGHYAYNIRALGLDSETIPDYIIRKRMVHTHIHSLYIPDDAVLPEEMPRTDTHYPIENKNDPVRKYIRTLMADGYSGIYNIELEPERFSSIFSPRYGFETSVVHLMEMLS